MIINSASAGGGYRLRPVQFLYSYNGHDVIAEGNGDTEAVAQLQMYQQGAHLTAANNPVQGDNVLLDVTGPGQLVLFTSPQVGATYHNLFDLILEIDGERANVTPVNLRQNGSRVLMMGQSFKKGTTNIMIAPDLTEHDETGIFFSESLKVIANFASATPSYHGGLSADKMFVYKVVPGVAV